MPEPERLPCPTCGEPATLEACRPGVRVAGVKAKPLPLGCNLKGDVSSWKQAWG